MSTGEGTGEGTAPAGTAPATLDRVTAAWRRSGAGGRVALVALGATGAALAGACLFGLWHVVVGGFLRGNIRAAEFGVGLAATVDPCDQPKMSSFACWPACRLTTCMFWPTAG